MGGSLAPSFSVSSSLLSFSRTPFHLLTSRWGWHEDSCVGTGAALGPSHSPLPEGPKESLGGCLQIQWHSDRSPDTVHMLVSVPFALTHKVGSPMAMAPNTRGQSQT